MQIISTSIPLDAGLCLMKAMFGSKSKTWGVVALVSEPDPLIYAFVAHYVDLGADRISLYLDTPNAALKRNLEMLSSVQVIECDDTYWDKLPFERPVEPTWRQKIVAQECYNQAQTRWLFHCDADEFLIPDQRLLDLLAARNCASDYIVIRTIERVHVGTKEALSSSDLSIFDGALRLPYRNNALLKRLHENVAGLMSNGLSGYDGGKSFVRTGQNLFMGIHQPNEETPRYLIRDPYSPLILAHFDGLTKNLWVEKQLRKMKQRAGWRTNSDLRRVRMMTAIEAANEDQVALSSLFMDLKSLTAPQERELRNRALLRDNPLEIEETARRVFPSQKLDFSTGAIEAYTFESPADHSASAGRNHDTSEAYQNLRDYREQSISFGRIRPFFSNKSTLRRGLRALFQR